MSIRRTYTAEFPLVRHAKAFVDHVTGPGWSIIPGTLKQTSKIVVWESAPDEPAQYFQDMLETVGSLGSAPQGPKAKLNGRIAPAEY